MIPADAWLVVRDGRIASWHWTRRGADVAVGCLGGEVAVLPTAPRGPAPIAYATGDRVRVERGTVMHALGAAP